MNPNASLLLVLTLSKETEQVVFLYSKELEERAPNKIFWYKDKGQNGKAEYLWEEKKLKEWLLIGTDAEINEINKILLTEKIIKIPFNDVEVTFQFLTNELILLNEEDIDKIDGVPFCSELSKYKFIGLKSDISFLVNNADNCSFLEGSKIYKNIKSIYPPGFLPDGYLHKNFKEFILASTERRRIYFYFRGNKDKIKLKQDPDKYLGFIQADTEFKINHKVQIYDLVKDDCLAEANIDPFSGKWEANLIRPIGRGRFYLKEKALMRYIAVRSFIF